MTTDFLEGIKEKVVDKTIETVDRHLRKRALGIPPYRRFDDLSPEEQAAFRNDRFTREALPAARLFEASLLRHGYSLEGLSTVWSEAALKDHEDEYREFTTLRGSYEFDQSLFAKNYNVETYPALKAFFDKVPDSALVFDVSGDENAPCELVGEYPVVAVDLRERPRDLTPELLDEIVRVLDKESLTLNAVCIESLAAIQTFVQKHEQTLRFDDDGIPREAKDITLSPHQLDEVESRTLKGVIRIQSFRISVNSFANKAGSTSRLTSVFVPATVGDAARIVANAVNSHPREFAPYYCADSPGFVQNSFPCRFDDSDLVDIVRCADEHLYLDKSRPFYIADHGLAEAFHAIEGDRSGSPAIVSLVDADGVPAGNMALNRRKGLDFIRPERPFVMSRDQISSLPDVPIEEYFANDVPETLEGKFLPFQAEGSRIDVSPQNDPDILVAQDFPSGYAISKSVEKPVCIAFSQANVRDVAYALHSAHPDAHIHLFVDRNADRVVFEKLDKAIGSHTSMPLFTQSEMRKQDLHTHYHFYQARGSRGFKKLLINALGKNAARKCPGLAHEIEKMKGKDR